MTVDDSATLPGQPWVKTSGVASGRGERRWRKWMPSPSTTVRNWPTSFSRRSNGRIISSGASTRSARRCRRGAGLAPIDRGLGRRGCRRASGSRVEVRRARSSARSSSVACGSKRSIQSIVIWSLIDAPRQPASGTAMTVLTSRSTERNHLCWFHDCSRPGVSSRLRARHHLHGDTHGRFGAPVERVPTPARLADWLREGGPRGRRVLADDLAARDELREAIHVAASAQAVGQPRLATPSRSSTGSAHLTAPWRFSPRTAATMASRAARDRRGLPRSRGRRRDRDPRTASAGAIALCSSPTCRAGVLRPQSRPHPAVVRHEHCGNLRRRRGLRRGGV